MCKRSERDRARAAQAKGNAKRGNAPPHLSEDKWPPPRDSKCHLCHKVAKKLHRTWNRRTGEVQGYLCTECSRKLGWLEENRAKVKHYLNPFML